MSRVLPILFNANIVRAILDGRKTVTRRIVKPQPDWFDCGIFQNRNTPMKSVDGISTDWEIKQPYQAGDILYVRETWCKTDCFGLCNGYVYRADFEKKKVLGFTSFTTKWHPSLHMPKAAARIWLKVTNVKVERLQDITNEQILKEGASKDTINSYIKKMPEETQEWIDTAYKLEWQQLWDSTVKEDWKKWNANPWIWVIEFERCEKPEREGIMWED